MLNSIIFPDQKEYILMDEPSLDTVFSFDINTENTLHSKKLGTYFCEEDQEYYVAGFYYNYSGIRIVYSKNLQSVKTAILFHKFETLAIEESSEEHGLLYKDGKPFIYFSDQDDLDCFLTFVDSYNTFLESVLLICFDQAEKQYDLLIDDRDAVNAIQNIVDLIHPLIFENIQLNYSFLCRAISMDYITSAYLGISTEEKEKQIFVLKQQDKLNEFVINEVKKLIAAKEVFFHKYATEKYLQGIVSYLLLKKVCINKYANYYQELYNQKYDGIRKFKHFARWAYEKKVILPNNEKEMALMSWFALKFRSQLSVDVYDEYIRLSDLYQEMKKEDEKDHFIQLIFSKRNENSLEIKYEKDTVKKTDRMTGKEFEIFISDLFSRKGYTTNVTKASGDQGIDITANKDGVTIGIQAKCYASKVGNSAIQEAVAGKAFYHLDRVMVVTNNYFTKSAIDLAESNGVILWDRDRLEEEILKTI